MKLCPCQRERWRDRERKEHCWNQHLRCSKPVTLFILSLLPADKAGRDEYKMKGVEEVKYMRGGEEDRVNARNQENLHARRRHLCLSHALSSWCALAGLACSTNQLPQEYIPKLFTPYHLSPTTAHFPTQKNLREKWGGLEREKSAVAYRGKQHKEVPGPTANRTNIHMSESQQEFFRMLDEKIEKGRDYCSEEDDDADSVTPHRSGTLLGGKDGTDTQTQSSQACPDHGELTPPIPKIVDFLRPGQKHTHRPTCPLYCVFKRKSVKEIGGA
ncbi:hypothetical protein JZ751_025159 [Albula glossodonta]|uniref:Uncharacterized protein n=1 Tax=Albula glossodonta TaxID=121402 RepID=A0A8T2PMV2_9TELE|nr:hypothetical protein JZ751_025159 [Albula glossodonta]